MRTLLVVSLLLLLAWPGPAPGQSPFRAPILSDTLSNGLRLIMIPYDTPGVVAYWTVVRAGARNEIEPGRTGYAHLFEHLMFRGTKRYPREAYNRVMALLGADHNAFTDDDWTVYTTTIPSTALEQMVEIQADRFQNLFYDEEAYIQETGAVLGEFNIGRASPETVLEETLRRTAYRRHTYRHTVIGWEADVRAMPEAYAYSLEFYRRYYRPENCAVVVVGDFDPERLRGWVAQHYGSWPRGGPLPEPPQEPPQREARREEILWPEATSPRLAVAFHVPAFRLDGPEAPALELIREIAFGATSPFRRRWVEETGKAYSVGAEVPRRRDPGLFVVRMNLKDAGDLETARREILETLERLARGGVGPEALGRARSHLRNSLAARLETAGQVAFAVAEFWNLTGDPEAIGRYFDLLQRVRPEDIQRIAARYFVESNSTTVVLRGKGS
jgi:zinc protease